MSSSSHRIQFSDIAVIIAAKNEEKNIKACVDSVLVATDGQTEIIVVDDGSTDQTGVIINSFDKKIMVISTAGVGASSARNAAIAQTKKDYVAFVDADCLVDAKWLKSLVHGFNHKNQNYISIGGLQKRHPDANAWDSFHCSFLECLGFVSDYVHDAETVQIVKHNPTCNVLYIKNEILEVGGFDPKLWPCEDLDLDIRISKTGKLFLFTPEAIVYHHRPDTFWGFMRMMYRYGFGHAQIVKKHGLCQKIHALPILIFLPLLLYFEPFQENWFKISLAILLIGYAMLLFRSKSLIRALIYGFYLIPTIVLWNIGFISGLFQPMKIASK